MDVKPDGWRHCYEIHGFGSLKWHVISSCAISPPSRASIADPTQETVQIGRSQRYGNTKMQLNILPSGWDSIESPDSEIASSSGHCTSLCQYRRPKFLEQAGRHEESFDKDDVLLPDTVW